MTYSASCPVRGVTIRSVHPHASALGASAHPVAVRWSETERGPPSPLPRFVVAINSPAPSTFHLALAILAPRIKCGTTLRLRTRHESDDRPLGIAQPLTDGQRGRPDHQRVCTYRCISGVVGDPAGEAREMLKFLPELLENCDETTGGHTKEQTRLDDINRLRTDWQRRGLGGPPAGCTLGTGGSCGDPSFLLAPVARS
jgi:hypothetical protein